MIVECIELELDRLKTEKAISSKDLAQALSISNTSAWRMLNGMVGFKLKHIKVLEELNIINPIGQYMRRW